MDSQTTRKIIVASGMAAVVGISVVAFALSSHHSTSAAQVSPAQDSLVSTPAAPAAVVPAPAAPDAVAQTPAAPAVAQVPAAPAAVAPIPDAPAVAQPKAARNRHLAKASTSADTTTRVVTPAEPTVEKPAGETPPAQSVDSVKSADEVTTPSAPSGTTTGAQEGSASTEPAAPDAGSPPK
jgi:outer membrane biosynthesis protein TonB